MVVLAPAIQVLDSADEENLEGRHERGGAGAIQDLLQVDLSQVHVVEAKFANVGGHQMLQDRLAATLAEERLVSDEHVSGSQLAGFDIGDEPVGSGKAAHLVRLQNVADQRLGKAAGDTLPRRSRFFEKAGRVIRLLVLLAVQEVRIAP